MIVARLEATLSNTVAIPFLIATVENFHRNFSFHVEITWRVFIFDEDKSFHENDYVYKRNELRSQASWSESSHSVPGDLGGAYAPILEAKDPGLT